MRKMKDSGIEWIGEIPNHWDCVKGKYVLRYVQKPVKANDGVITCFRDGEVTLRSNRREEGFTVADKEIGYQGIDVGDLVVHGMDGFAGAIGISDSRGKASPVLNVLDTDENKRYIMYYLRSLAFREVFLAMTTGIRVRSCDLRWNKLSELIYLIPPQKEQLSIVNFLDSKCAEINALTSDIQVQIDNLIDYKKSVVFKAVSQGVRPVKMKKTDSAVWTEIPYNWSLVDIKYLFEIVKRIAGKEGYDILSVTQKGLKVKDISSNEGQIASNYSGYQFVYPTDYVMNHMDLLTGWVDYSTQFGVTSPDYRVFRLRDKENYNLDYYKYVMQCCYMCRIFYSLGQGVSNLGRWRLQTSSFMNFQVPVPPLNEQKKIAEYLDHICGEIDDIIDEKNRQLSVLADYKKSLIYEYVTGKKEVPLAVSDMAVAFDPHIIMLGIVIDKLGKEIRGKIQLQKMLYLMDEHIGLNRSTQYYRYAHGPYDLELDHYVEILVSNHWYEQKHQGADLLVPGKNHADFVKAYHDAFSDQQKEIDKLITFLKPMKTSQVERIATLYAAWNDFMIDGNVAPTDSQIIHEVMTNWTNNKANTKYSTWQGTLDKMKKNGIIPKGLGLHTLPKM